MNRLTEMGAYEAKTRLSELLRLVQSGQSFTITHRGVAVADLVPSDLSFHRDACVAAARMQQFMQSAVPVSSAEIQTLIEEGRD